MEEPGLGRRRLDPDEELRLTQEAVRRITRRVTRLTPLVLGLLLLGWLATGIYTVQPGEVGVIRTVGAFTGTTRPGLNYRMPSPFQQVDIVDVQAVRRIEVGFRTEGGRANRVATEALMLTGDENIVDAQIIVQYRVRQPEKYLFNLRSPDDAVRASTEVALRGVTGKMQIDDILTTRRSEAQQRTAEELQRLLDLYESGILVTNVQLQTVDVPDQVKDAFNEVVRAFQDRDRLKNEAEAYVADILPKARGQAQQTVRAAEAYREQRIIQAQGDAARFEALLAEYTKAKAVTRERLRLETVERVLVDVDKIVIDGSAGSNLLPFLPLRDGAATQPSQPQSQTPPQPQAQPPTPPRAAPTPAAQPQQQPAQAQPTPRPSR
ncbi:MAG: FtsH protease activity modulator HflK [Chloroflexi bacterium]|nr:FtsH protease activity modulator HflK [Chloroflexota bacterium]